MSEPSVYLTPRCRSIMSTRKGAIVVRCSLHPCDGQGKLVIMAQHFFFRLLPPRPTFAHDMNADEQDLMMQHISYVRGFFEAGKVLAFGPVLDPAGSFGMGLLEMEDLDEAERFATNDPTIKAGLNTYTIVPMRLGASQASPSAQA